MRALLPALLVGAMLAGCTTAPGDDAVLDVSTPESSHPAYGFETLQETTWPRPVHAGLPSPLTGLEALSHVEGTDTGGGIAIFGPYAFIGGRGSGPMHVVDIMDPASPRVLASVPDVPVRDADTIAFPPSAPHPDGRLIVITTSGGGSQFATDVTVPAKARLVGQIETEHGNHNIAVVPGTPITYNSGSSGVIDIVDWSVPEEPRQIGTFANGNGCHDITFYISQAEEKYRAYCAAYGESEIWDITDPKEPTMVVEIPYPTMEKGVPVAGGMLPDTAVFPLSFSHLAMPDHDAGILIVGDETGGGGINGCDVYADTPAGTVSGPIGNLWFYDISDETAPELLGHVSPSAADALDGSCTAHFGRVIEDTGHLVMGFYAAGVVLVDFTDPSDPVIVHRLDQEGSIWDVWYYQGYLFTGDMARGMDVLRLV